MGKRHVVIKRPYPEAGANRSPCSNVYAGARPFSEPEVAGLNELITWQIPDLKIYASLHSYGQLFLSPWGYTIDKPPNYDDQVRIDLRPMKLWKESIENGS